MKRAIALVLALCLALLTGCGGRASAALISVAQGEPAAQALCGAADRLSYALASGDEAALQQVQSGQCELALVTEQGLAAAQGRAELVERVTLGVFLILSNAGEESAWDRNTRVVIVGEEGGDGDALAQQVLSCALYGAVRYAGREEALAALRSNRADVVMGMMAPQDDGVRRALDRGTQLLSMPESLAIVRLPHDSMAEFTVTIEGQSANSYALKGALVRANGTGAQEAAERAAEAARSVGLAQDAAVGVILE